jgi:hypothetical protein
LADADRSNIDFHGHRSFSCERNSMRDENALKLRQAIEDLINAKLCDVLGRQDGFARLMGHRASGVASKEIRHAEQMLETTLTECLLQGQPSAMRREDRRLQ